MRKSSFFFALFISCLLTSAISKGQQKTTDPYVMLDTLKAQIGREAIEDKKIWLTIRLAITYKSVGNFKDGLETAKNAVLLAEKTNSKRVASAYNMVGIFNKDLGNYDEAILIYQKVLRIVTETNDQSGIASTNVNLANIYADQGRIDEALAAYKAAIPLYEKLKSKDGLGIALANIGGIYMDQGKYPEALNNMFAAYNLFLAVNYKGGMGGTYNNIGDIYRKQGNYGEASKYLFSSLKYYDEAKDDAGRILANISLGNLYADQSNYDEALKYHRSSLQIADGLGQKKGVADALNNIGFVYLLQGKYTEALKGSSAKINYQLALDYHNKALTLANSIGSKKITQNSYEGQANVYEKINDFKKAYEFKSFYSAIKDSLINDQTSKKIESLRLEYEVQKAKADEQTKQEKQKTAMQLEFDRREDSIKIQQKLTALQLTQQTFISRQQEQDLKLKQASLELLNRQNELNRLNFLKSQAELETEQTKREEKEQELTIANQEKSLQTAQLNLQQTQLNLKENQIKAEKRQRLFYIGGIALLILLFVFIYRNIRNRQRTERLIATERLKTEKASAAHSMAELELQSLRAQLNPHFMFNSLNAIQELILKEDNENSHLYLSRFSELLRMLLDNANQPFVPLQKELHLLEIYLSLEQLRIPDLKYSIEIDKDVDVNKMTIPNMMLQPYIENAIWHGLSHKKGEKNLFIRINKRGDGVVCKVEDNGVGRKVSTELKGLYRKEHRSRGMELLSKRFSLLSKEYGSDIQTNIEDLHDNGTATGTKVSIVLPHSLTAQTQPVYS